MNIRVSEFQNLTSLRIFIQHIVCVHDAEIIKIQSKTSKFLYYCSQKKILSVIKLRKLNDF